jgi:hypothetical protein
VKTRRKNKTNPDLVNTGRYLLWRQVEVDAQRGQNVRAAAAR